MRGSDPDSRPAQRHEEGAVAVLVALLLVVFVAMVAIAVDVGGLYLRRRELVNGSDAAALSAGRTCARGGSDDRFAAPEEAADHQVQENGRITGFEVGGAKITSMTSCGQQWGHVSVEYTSQQERSSRRRSASSTASRSPRPRRPAGGSGATTRSRSW